MMTEKVHHKARLPCGWVVCTSKTYPDKIYYFNQRTGDSCWECPQLVSSDDPTKKESVESKSQDEKFKNKVRMNEEKKHFDETLKCVINKTKSKVNCTKTKDSPSRGTQGTNQMTPHINLGPVRPRFKLKRPRPLKDVNKGLASQIELKKCDRITECIQQSEKQPLAKVTPLEKTSACIYQKQLVAKVSPVEKSAQHEIKQIQPQGTSGMPLGKKKQLSADTVPSLKESTDKNVQLPYKIGCLLVHTTQFPEQTLQPKNKKAYHVRRKKKRRHSAQEETPSLEEGVQKKLISLEKNIHSPEEKVHSPLKRYKLPEIGEDPPMKKVQPMQPIMKSDHCHGVEMKQGSNFISTTYSSSRKDEQSHNVCLKVTPQDDSTSSDMEMLDVSTELTSLQVLHEPMQTDDFSEDDKGFCIVVDTNVLINDLKFVDELKDLPLEGTGPPIIYIPWVVIQELDALKNNRNKKVSADSSSKAGDAVRYLHAWLTGQHPRIQGQTATEDRNQRKQSQTQTNDDAILHCCLELTKKVPKEHLILLTNDKNLCNKALINDVRAYTRDSLLQHIKVDFSDIMSIVTRGDSTISVPPIDALSSVEMKKEVDKLVCAMKLRLKKLLEPIVVNGMQDAFGDDWTSIIAVSPPWTLLDVLYCLKKHWIAVFGSIFTRMAQKSVESLLKELKLSKGYIYDEKQASNMINTAVELCFQLRKKCVHQDILQQLQEIKSACHLLCTKKKSKLSKDKKGEASVAKPEDDSHSRHIKVLSVFQHIWDLINHLCGIVLDTLNCHHSFIYIHPEVLPNREEILNFIPRLYPQLQQLKRKMLCVVQPESGIPFRTVSSHLFHVLHTFVPSLEIQAEEPPLTDITEDVFFEFCCNENNQDLLQNGYLQLTTFYDAIHRCIHDIL